MNLPRDYCRECKWRNYDMDGEYCAHSDSLAVSCGYGRNLDYARGTVCQHAKLFEPRVPVNKETTNES